MVFAELAVAGSRGRRIDRCARGSIVAAVAYKHEEVAKTPAGYRVRSVKRGSHVVRVAFPPGPRRKGAGKVVEILHPKSETNPSCIVSNQARTNPGELLIFGNPSYKAEGYFIRRSLYHQIMEAAKARGETFTQESLSDGRVAYRYQGKLYTPGELADKLGVRWPNPHWRAGQRVIYPTAHGRDAGTIVKVMTKTVSLRLDRTGHILSVPKTALEKNPSTAAAKRTTRERAARIRSARLNGRNPWYGAGNFKSREEADKRAAQLRAAGHTVSMVVSARGTSAENYSVYTRKPVGNPRAFAGWKHFTKKEKNFLRTIHAPAPKNEEDVRAYKEVLRKIDEINAQYRKANPRRLSVPEQHQLKIAIATLRMPDAMVGVMGGPNKEQAREIIRRLTGRQPKENQSFRETLTQGSRQVIIAKDAEGTKYHLYPYVNNGETMVKSLGSFARLETARAKARKWLSGAGRNPRKRRNPDQTGAAVRLFEKFHGRDPKEITEKHVSAAMRKDYTALGDLEYLMVCTPLGQTVKFQFEGDGVKLASSPDGKQLYCIGGNQNLTSCLTADSLEKDFVDLGTALQVQYLARKVHANFEPTSYYHKFGEKTGARPQLMYDKLKRNIFFVGGEYFIDTKHGVSPGIEN